MSTTKCAEVFFSPLIDTNTSTNVAIASNMTPPSAEMDTNTSIYVATAGNITVGREEIDSNTSKVVTIANNITQQINTQDKNQRSKKGSATKRVHEMSSNSLQQSAHKKIRSGSPRKEITTSSEGVQQRPNVEVCSTSTQQELGDSNLWSKTMHSYLFSDFVMLNEPAKYKMTHYDDFEEEYKESLRKKRNGCVDCASDVVIHIDADVVLYDIEASKEYHYCKMHATTYAKMGTVLTLNRR
jgi:hypothetical protein